MFSHRTRLILFWIIITFSSVHHSQSYPTLKKAGNYFSFIDEILDQSEVPKQCTLVLVTHSKTFGSDISPDFFSKLSRPWLELILPDDFTTEATNENATFPYPWPASNPDAPSVGNCIVFAVFFVEELIDKLLEYIPSKVLMFLQRDYFLLLNMDEKLDEVQIENILVKSAFVYPLKYKILPVFADDGSVEIYTTCFYCNGGKPKIVTLPSTGQKNIPLLPIFPDFTWNMNGTTLKYSFSEDKNKTDVERMFANKDLAYYFTHHHIWIISEFLNFNFEIFNHPLGAIAAMDAQNEDKSWDGHAGAILDGMADLSGGSIYNAELMKYIDYTNTLANSYFRIILGKPRNYFTPWAVVTPFSLNLWICILVTISVSGIFYTFIIKLAETERFFSELTSCETYSYTLYYLFYSMLGWSSTLMPTSSGSRVLISVWLCYGIIITFFYQSMMTSLMTAPQKEIQPKTFKDVLDMNYEYSSDAFVLVYFQYLLREIEVDYLIQIRDGIVSYDTLDDCFDASLVKSVVCISVREIYTGAFFRFLDEDYKPQLHVSFHDGVTVIGSLIHSKKFIPTSSYNRGVFIFLENGFINQYVDLIDSANNFFVNMKKKRAMEREKRNDEVSLGKGEVPLKMEHFQGAYFILAVGLGLATLVFIVKEYINF